MKGLVDYLSEIGGEQYKLTVSEKNQLLALDKEYGDIYLEFREVHNGKDVLNFKEEVEKFVDAYNSGKKYYPQLKFHKDKEDLSEFRDRIDKLILKFRCLTFDCILIKYYILNLEILIHDLNRIIDMKNNYPVYSYQLSSNLLETEYFNKALEIIKNTNYEAGISNNRDKDAEYAKDKIQKALDKLKYPWEIKIVDDMVPRMNVLPNKIVRIKKTATFSDIDIDGLIAHEIKGHVGRRFYGAKTGLNLFIHGLPDRNILDEGLAIWNSLNLCKNPKPNILYNIALKCIIAYYSQHFDIYGVFEKCKRLCPKIEDKKLAAAVLRNKRKAIDTSQLDGWPTDAHYFVGYQIVNKMTDEERDDILKYNIGPDQLYELPVIKKFLKVNEFTPLI